MNYSLLHPCKASSSRRLPSPLSARRSPSFNPCKRLQGHQLNRGLLKDRIRADVTVHAASTNSQPAENLAEESPFAKVCATLTTWFPAWVALGCLTALWKPTLYLWFTPYVVPALALTMLGMGTTMTIQDFKNVLAQPYLVGLGALLQYTIMPGLGFAASQVFGLSAPLAAGLILVSCCPGGTASNIVTYLARADVALSVLMTTASTFLACLLTPFLTKLLVGTLVPVDAWALFLSTVQVVLLPVLGGMLLNQFFPKQVAKASVVSPLIASVTVALICASVIAKNASLVLQAGPELLAALVFLHMGGFTLGYVVSRLALKQSERTSRTISIEVGMQNSALGASLAMLHFLPESAVPCAISACMHSILGSGLAGFWAFKDSKKL